MSEFLDHRTLILLISLFYLVLPLSVWLVLRMPMASGPLLWSAGGTLGGLGFALMGLRSQIPDTWSYLAGQPALVMGAFMAIQGLRHDLGRPWPWLPIVGAIAAYAAALAYVLETMATPAVGVLVRSVNLSVIACLVHTAWQVSRNEHSRNALTIAGAYGLQGLGIVLNLVSAWAGSQDIHTLQGSNVNIIAYFTMILVPLVAYMAYLGLALERSTRQALALTEEAIRTEQWRARRLALVQSDRERILTVLTDSLSHSLLQPLTAASLQLQMGLHSLRQGRLEATQIAQSLQLTEQAIQRANATVERMRAMVRPKPAQRTRMVLQDLLQDVEQFLHQRALAQQTSLIMPRPAKAIELLGDPIALSHALLQLMENALTALNSQPVRRITVDTEATKDRLILRINDSGPGFPEPVLQRFASERGARTPSLQGIGLFVVQSIVTQHQGTVLLENPPSGGARVTLEIPRHTHA